MKVAAAGKWYATDELPGGVLRLTEPFVHDFVRANLYLVRGRDADLLVDTGMGLVPLTPALPLTPGKPVIALATHIHLDHVGALHEFDDRWGPTHSADKFATMPDILTYAGMFRELPDPLAMLPAKDWQASAYALRPAPLTRTLDEGDRVDLGDRLLEVLHLPGHSPDSIALFDAADGLFLSGDAIYPAGLIDDLPDSDPAIYRQTMRRILDLPVRLALGGHGSAMTGDEMRAVARRYLETGAA